MAAVEDRRCALMAAARMHDGSAWSSEVGSSASASVLEVADAFLAWLTEEGDEDE